jgi:Flp pilus assembly protein CpaB
VTTEITPQVRTTAQRPGDPSTAARPGRPGVDGNLPRLPRRYGQWAAAVLFVLVSVLAAGWVWQQRSDRIEVLAVVHEVPAGAVLDADDLQVVEVAGVEGAVRATDASSVIGSTVGVALLPGQVLTENMVTADPVPGAGERIVGLELDGTRAPGGLAPGDRVTVLAVPPTGDASTPSQLSSPTVLAAVATVQSVDRVEGAGTRFALLVPQDAADQVAAFGAAGRVSLVQAPLGGDG